MKRLSIIDLRDGLVICGGAHDTAKTHGGDCLGTHAMLQPVFHLGEIKLSGAPAIGDSIVLGDDGSKCHEPRARG